MSYLEDNLSSSNGKNNEGRPRLVSLNNSRLLESKRNNIYLDQSCNKTLQTSHRVPGSLLTSLLSNPPRTMTPIRPKISEVPYFPNDVGSKERSPKFSASPERAYMHPTPRLNPRPSQFRFPPEPSLAVESSGPCLDSSRRFSEPITDQQLSTNKSTEESIQMLREDHERLQLRHAQVTRKLDDLCSKLQDAAKQSEEYALELKQIRPAFSLVRETLASKEAELASTAVSLAEAKSSLLDLRRQNTLLTEALTKETMEKTRLETGSAALKAGFSKLSASYNELGESLKELEKTQTIPRTQLQELVNENVETKRLAKNALAALAPILDDKVALTRAAETKNLLNGLSHDLSSSYQVTDILRDKLTHMSSQLCDAQQRVKELEEEKRGALNQLLTMRQEEFGHLESIAVIEKRMTDLSEKLAIRESDTIALLADAAAVEAKLESATAQLKISKDVQDAQTVELQVLRAEQDKNVSNILALQNMLNSREKELVSAKADVKGLTESKAELRALLAESKKDLSQKILKLEARDPNIDLEGKVRELEGSNAELQRNSNEYLKLLNSRQEMESVLQFHNARIQNSLEELKENLKTSVSMEFMNDKCHALNDEFQQKLKESNAVSKRLLEESEELKGRLNDQSAHLFKSKEDCAVLKERVNSLSDKLSSTQSLLNKAETSAALITKLQEQRAMESENLASSLQVRLDTITTELRTVKTKLGETERQLSEAKEAAELAKGSTAHELSEKVKAGLGLIIELEKENVSLKEAAAGILTRYHSGHLTDIEKRFVGYLMDEGDRMHAESVVKKENELRRRQVAVNELKVKNTELQGTLARLLKEKEAHPGVVNRSLVDLKNWVSSSPMSDQPSGPTVEPHAQKEPMQPPGPGNLDGQDSSRIHDTEDSEDDTPLSELNRPAEGGKNTGNKRNRSESPPGVEEPNHSKRRTRTSIVPSGPPQAESVPLSPATKKKISESTTTKPKQKKRK